jgi:hypothetical protein
VIAVQAPQNAGALPAGDPERLEAFALSAAHGAVDLEISGRLSRTGMGKASAQDLVDDLGLPAASR